MYNMLCYNNYKYVSFIGIIVYRIIILGFVKLMIIYPWSHGKSNRSRFSQTTVACSMILTCFCFFAFAFFRKLFFALITLDKTW